MLCSVIDASSASAAGNQPGAAVVRGFYDALGRGNGAEASKFIVSESRSGPFSPEAMSRFYGGLEEPLRLVHLQPIGPDQFFVRYVFRIGARRCFGRAIATTVTRGGSNFISDVKAIDGC